MSAAEWQPTAADFGKAEADVGAQRIVRPSISYWQDAWQRLKRNPRAVISLGLVVALGLFAIAGPWVWRVDPAEQPRAVPERHRKHRRAFELGRHHRRRVAG